ncbi:MAG: hypothetical protein LAT81_16495 [Oceanicaulis sp.]|nr:hypothetical protein [Oceanicaulis sp.]
MNKIENSTKKLEFINQWISNCDTKSSFILTFFGVVLTIIFTSNTGGDMINTFSYNLADEINIESFGNFILLIMSISFFLASSITFFYIYSTLKGRIDSSVYQQNRLNINSNIFFGSISLKSFEDFENQITIEDEPTYLNDLYSQIYINSKIVDTKFKHYNKSLVWMFVTFGIFIIYVIVK